eukprot:PhF_6_TR35750/c0_g1_i2/m.51921
MSHLTVCICVLFCSLIITCISSAPLVRVMPMGDSITQGLTALTRRRGIHPINGTTSYRRHLYKMLGCRMTFVGPFHLAFLGAAPIADFPLDHASRWGIRASEMSSMIAQHLDTGKYKPNVILLLLGTNDLGLCRGIDAECITTTLTHVATVVRKTQTVYPAAQMYVSTLLPTTKSYGHRIAKYNEELLQSPLCTTTRLVVCTDLVAKYIIPDVHLYDGLHPNWAGEEVLAEGWASALHRVIPKCGMSTTDTTEHLEHREKHFRPSLQDEASSSSSFWPVFVLLTASLCLTFVCTGKKPGKK